MQSSEFPNPPRYDDQPDLGDIRINHNVIAGIVRLAALQVKGVAGVGGGIADGIGEIFTKKEADNRGVRVNETEEGQYAIEVRIVVTYGAEIGQTAYEVQLDVRKQIMAMSGKDVSKVDVTIEGVRLPGDKSSNEDDLWPEQSAED